MALSVMISMGDWLSSLVIRASPLKRELSGTPLSFCWKPAIERELWLSLILVILIDDWRWPPSFNTIDPCSSLHNKDNDLSIIRTDGLRCLRHGTYSRKAHRQQELTKENHSLILELLVATIVGVVVDGTVLVVRSVRLFLYCNRDQLWSILHPSNLWVKHEHLPSINIIVSSERRKPRDPIAFPGGMLTMEKDQCLYLIFVPRIWIRNLQWS